MQPHQQRLVHEQTELQDKSTKLAEFIKSSPIFAGLDGNQQGLLKAQLGAMQAYSEILILRIAAF
ncbi:hypothetical protein REV13_10725 [Klebsiella pneumoniae]|uniref:crAss001_48 related protein n=1 Tax=Klebsiella pneumoniae TaxID=573 RepID=UPI002AABA0A5|nr:hypothetical protein [Klebsiella pneumoniae]WPU88837.1 hypothetical protein REV13_10725 [Klebsiella pneumoniae]HBY5949273.1 hypothetical protein [Klebsiella pneumoniae]